MRFKKTIAIIACVLQLFAVTAFSSGCVDRANILRVYNWEDYIDTDLIEAFEEYYLEKTEKEIKVEYSTFDTNETMYTKVARSKTDYDVVCPSDYMIEKMYYNGLLLPLDMENIPNALSDGDNGGLDPRIAENNFNPDRPSPGGELRTYAVPYTIGTVGVMYNSNIVSDEEATSWEILWDTSNKELKNKVYMKNSIRDTMAVAAIYANREELMEMYESNDPNHSERVYEIMNDTSKSALKAAENALIKQKDFLKGYEVDNGKDEMVIESAYMGMVWNGDAVWSMFENQDLRYYVPHEGSNVFFDGWVIPKYAKNKTAAEEWINFITDAENAFLCMDYVGYTSAVKLAQDLYKDYVTGGTDFIDVFGEDYEEFGTFEEAMEEDFTTEEGRDFLDAITSTLFPDDEVFKRCSVFKDFGSKANDVLETWARIMIA